MRAYARMLVLFSTVEIEANILYRTRINTDEHGYNNRKMAARSAGLEAAEAAHPVVRRHTDAR